MISANNVNLPNMTDNQAITENKLCLSQDSHYKLVDNHCVYFEKNLLNFDSADTNCKEKLGSHAGLYEPNDIEEMKKIAKLAGESGIASWPWIGVSDKRIENQWAYHSNGLRVKFNPYWFLSYGSEGRGKDCVCMSTASTVDWANKICTELRSSICQSMVIGQ